MISRGIDSFCDSFRRGQTYSTTPGMNGWTIADTSASGTPTYANQAGGGFKATLASTSEAENVCLYQNDVLGYPVAQVKRAEFEVSVSGVDAATVVAFGLGSARADDEDTVATNAFFKIEGSSSTSALVAETDDGTTDTDDKATGVTLGSTPKKCVIDFSQGLSDVRFYVDGARVAASTTFSMAAASAANVQPMVQISKASGTGTPAVTLHRIEIVTAYSYGA